jgi:LysM repeat protein
MVEETFSHQVMKGETLYAISKKYGVTVEQIQQWNNMNDIALREGQLLTIRRMKIVEIPSDEEAHQGAEILIPSSPINTTNASLRETFDGYMAGDYLLLNERGMSVWIEQDTDNSNKHYCFHNTAPIGSVLLVKNLVNNTEVLVKVIGKIPENAANKGALCRVSYQAAQDLGVLDQKFVVEITRYVARSDSQVSR